MAVFHLCIFVAGSWTIQTQKRERERVGGLAGLPLPRNDTDAAETQLTPGSTATPGFEDLDQIQQKTCYLAARLTNQSIAGQPVVNEPRAPGAAAAPVAIVCPVCWPHGCPRRRCRGCPRLVSAPPPHAAVAQPFVRKAHCQGQLHDAKRPAQDGRPGRMASAPRYGPETAATAGCRAAGGSAANRSQLSNITAIYGTSCGWCTRRKTTAAAYAIPRRAPACPPGRE